MAKLVNWYEFERALKGKRIPLFSATEICRLFGATRIAATFLLHRYAKKGFIMRVKRGLYAFPESLPPEPFIANRMYGPSYVSLAFALSYHGVIPETVYEMTSITTKSTRCFQMQGKTYSYRHVIKAAFTGYRAEKQAGFTFLIAEGEKAFVDATYFRIFDRMEPLSRFDKKKLNAKKALYYAKLFGNQKLTDLIKSILP